MIDITKLSKDEREFVVGIINRLDSGDVENLGTELLAEFKTALTPKVQQKGCRLADVLCRGKGAEAFNEAMRDKTALHMLCIGYALGLESKNTSRNRSEQ